jgi:hypothetical protein
LCVWRFSQRCGWRFKSSEIWLGVDWYAHVSEILTASFFVLKKNNLLRLSRECRFLFQKNLNSWYNFLLHDMNENCLRLWNSVSVTYFMHVEIRPFRCSYKRDLADVIVYAQCILRNKYKITWFCQKDYILRAWNKSIIN